MYWVTSVGGPERVPELSRATVPAQHVRLRDLVTRDRFIIGHVTGSWWRGTVVERRSLTGELSLSCARPAADG